MPTYDYECTNCGYVFEVFQGITDRPLEKCPKCKKNLKRLISSGAGIIFKGSGFYATDYRKKTDSETRKPLSSNNCPKTEQGCNACAPSK
jgi:putative FmdB family regulatory protein